MYWEQRAIPFNTSFQPNLTQLNPANFIRNVTLPHLILNDSSTEYLNKFDTRPREPKSWRYPFVWISKSSFVFREGPDLKRANVARIEKSLSEKKNQIALKPNLLLNRLNRFFTGAFFRKKQNSFFGLLQKTAKREKLFCRTSYTLASTRWVWSTFSSCCSLSSKQRCWLTSATLIIFPLKKFTNTGNQT